MALALFLQSACTLHEVTAQEKPRAIWCYPKGYFGGNIEIDVAATQEVLKYLNADVHVFYIGGFEWCGGGDCRLRQLEELLSTNEIDMWVVGGSNTPRFNGDFIAWTEYMAKLSLKYPRLKAFQLDDFKPSRTTPAKFKAMLDAKDRINPNLKYWPVLYYDARAGLQWFMDGNSWDPILSRDGAHFSWWSSYYGGAPMHLKDLDQYLTQANQEVHPAPFVTSPYPIRWGTKDLGMHEDSLFHHPDTLRKMLKMSLDRSDGISLYVWTDIWLDGNTVKTSQLKVPTEKSQQTFQIIKEVFGAAAEPNFELSSGSLYFVGMQGG